MRGKAIALGLGGAAVAGLAVRLNVARRPAYPSGPLAVGPGPLLVEPVPYGKVAGTGLQSRSAPSRRANW